MKTNVFSIWNHHKKLLVGSFRFIWIRVLWVNGHCKWFYSINARIDLRRHILTSIDVRNWRLKSVPALNVLIVTDALLAAVLSKALMAVPSVLELLMRLFPLFVWWLLLRASQLCLLTDTRTVTVTCVHFDRDLCALLFEFRGISSFSLTRTPSPPNHSVGSARGIYSTLTTPSPALIILDIQSIHGFFNWNL